MLKLHKVKTSTTGLPLFILNCCQELQHLVMQPNVPTLKKVQIQIASIHHIALSFAKTFFAVK